MDLVDPQLASPLFSVLPAEIRRAIFSYALLPIYPVVNWQTEFLAKHDFTAHEGHDCTSEDDDEWEASPELPGLEMGIPGHHHSSFRPDLRGRPVLSPTLLLTCRRADREARHLLFESERCYWTVPEPPEGHSSRIVSDHWRKHDEGYPPHNLWSRERWRWEQQFTKMRLIGPIDGINMVMHARPLFISKVQHLRITVRLHDWDTETIIRRSSHGQAAPLYINALGRIDGRKSISWITGNCPPYNDAMWSAMEATKYFNRPGSSQATKTGPQAQCSSDGRPSWMPPGGEFLDGEWSREFVNMPCLKTFTMDFDASYRRQDELAAIVEWAVRTWRLPLNPNHAGYHYLSAEGNPVRKTWWRGTYHDWESLGCPECGEDEGIRWPRERPDCNTHARIWAKLHRGVGPRMLSWSVMWIPRTYDGPEVYPYEGSGCLGVCRHDIQGGNGDGSGAEFTVVASNYMCSGS